jgi:error-prone DNA polymerase
VIFVTLEGATGNINVIVWNGVLQKQPRELLGSTLLGVGGQIQRERKSYPSWRRG